MKPKSIPEGDKLVFGKGFSESICYLIRSGHISEIHVAIGHYLAHEMMLYSDMLGPRMVSRILDQGYCPLVIAANDNCLGLCELSGG